MLLHKINNIKLTLTLLQHRHINSNMMTVMDKSKVTLNMMLPDLPSVANVSLTRKLETKIVMDIPGNL